MRQPTKSSAQWPKVLCLSLAIAAAFPTCALGQTDSTRRLNAAETIKATQALSRWLDCLGCQAAEDDKGLEAVTGFGQAVVPSLVATLNAGLSPASRQMQHDLLATRYDQLDEQARKDPRFKMKSTQEEFISRYLDNLDARYRIRAAQALAAIGGAHARTALNAALVNPQRDDVRRAIQNALKVIK